MKIPTSPLTHLNYTPLAVLLAALFLLVSCTDEGTDGDPESDVPATYSFIDYPANADSVLYLHRNLELMVAGMEEGNDGSDVNAAILQEIWTDDEYGPSLSDITTEFYRGQVDTMLLQLDLASRGVRLDTFPIQPNGGPYWGYLFDEHGADLSQFIEKGLYQAAFYNRASQLLGGQFVLPQEVDRAFALYGAEPNFPNNSDDRFPARYAARRDNGGFYAGIKTNFLRARVAASDSRMEDAKDYATEVMRSWEEAIAATVIHNLYAVVDSMEDADAYGPKQAEAYHDWAEAVGLLNGFATTSIEFRRLSDEKINELLLKMRANMFNGEPPVPAELRQPQALADLESVIVELALIYGFDDPTIFQIDDVAENGRDL